MKLGENCILISISHGSIGDVGVLDRSGNKSTLIELASECYLRKAFASILYGKSNENYRNKKAMGPFYA